MIPINISKLTEIPQLDFRNYVNECMSGPRVIQLLLLDPTQVESKKSSQIQWPVPSINAEPVDIFLGEESIRKLWLK